MAMLRLPFGGQRKADKAATVLIGELDKFLRSRQRSAWLEDKTTGSRVYVRKEFRLVEGLDTPHPRSLDGNTLGIANISIAEGVQKRGIFSKFLEHAESYIGKKVSGADVQAVYIENVENTEVLNPLLQKRGYRVDNTLFTPGPQCWIKTR